MLYGSAVTYNLPTTTLLARAVIVKDMSYLIFGVNDVVNVLAGVSSISYFTSPVISVNVNALAISTSLEAYLILPVKEVVNATLIGNSASSIFST